MSTNRKTDPVEAVPDTDAPPTTRLSVRRKTEKPVAKTEPTAGGEPVAASKYDDVLNTVLRIAEGDGKFEHKLRRTQGIIASHHAAARAAHRAATNVDERVEADRVGLLTHLRQACDGGKLSPSQLELLEAVLAP
jgi:hypothetical protein